VLTTLRIIGQVVAGAISGFAACSVLGLYARIAANDLTMLQVVGTLFGATMTLVVQVRR
jgi:hypothetical protein